MFKSKFSAKVVSFFGIILLTILNVPPGFCSNGDPLPLEGRYAVSAAIGLDRAVYHIAKSESGLTADNQAQSYGAVFSSRGIEVRTGSAAFGLELTGYGYGSNVRPVEPAEPVASQNRVEYRRGPLTEWYVNGPFGLQQGFTLAKAPSGGRSNGEPLRVALKLRGGLKAEVDPDGRSLTLLDSGGVAAFEYDGLTVIDADGRAVPARLELLADMLMIDVDDRPARYPLTIDPFIQAAKLTASDGAADDCFGYSVSVSGDTVVVGANGDNDFRGSAYVFVDFGAGWIQTAKLTASDGAASEHFGYSVSVGGDVVVVGAVYAPVNGNISQGAVYVFVKPGGEWVDMTQTAKLTATDGAELDYLGRSVSISGDTIVAGASGDDFKRGSAYVFVKPGGGWADMTQTAKLTASDGVAEDRFGWSVSLSGDTVAIGAPACDVNRGSAYVFVKPGAGWTDMTQTAILAASDGEGFDYFGRSVSLSGDTIAVGAEGENEARGAAYVFVKPGGGWVDTIQTAKLTASDAAMFDNLGASISVSGDIIAAGAYADEGGRGSVYVFVKPGGGWIDANETAKLTASDGAVNDNLGTTVSVDGATILAGAYWDEGAIGSAYVFQLVQSLTVALAGGGAGTVVGLPGTINCPGTCVSNIPLGSVVTLTAGPAVGSALDGWTGAPCPGNGDCRFTMDADYTVTATFNTDSDGDGVSDVVEDAGPNGGDANQDGTQDFQQQKIATFKDVNGMWCTMVSGAPLTNVKATFNPSPNDMPAGPTPTCGFFGFKATGLIYGSAVTVAIVLHTPDPTLNDYWRYGPTAANPADHWYQFLDNGTTGAEIVHESGRTVVTLYLVDGGLGDDDLEVNGEILDVGAPTVSPGGGGGGDGGGQPIGGIGGGDNGGCFFESLFFN